MSARTPGPYKFLLDKTYGNANLYGKGRQLVAVVWSGRTPSMATVEANARALAAVDDLITALAQCSRALGPIAENVYAEKRTDASTDAIEAAHKALKKAGVPGY